MGNRSVPARNMTGIVLWGRSQLRSRVNHGQKRRAILDKREPKEKDRIGAIRKFQSADTCSFALLMGVILVD